jgi:hypothetical protein
MILVLNFFAPSYIFGWYLSTSFITCYSVEPANPKVTGRENKVDAII